MTSLIANQEFNSKDWNSKLQSCSNIESLICLLDSNNSNYKINRDTIQNIIDISIDSSDINSLSSVMKAVCDHVLHHSDAYEFIKKILNNPSIRNEIIEKNSDFFKNIDKDIFDPFFDFIWLASESFHETEYTVYKTIDAFCKAGVDKDALGGADNIKAVQHAFFYGSPAVINAYAKCFGKELINTSGPFGVTPIHKMACSAYTDRLVALLHLGADPKISCHLKSSGSIDDGFIGDDVYLKNVLMTIAYKNEDVNVGNLLAILETNLFTNDDVEEAKAKTKNESLREVMSSWTSKKNIDSLIESMSKNRPGVCR